MSVVRFIIAMLAVWLLTLFYSALAQAQAPNSGWSAPYRLSSDAGKASEGYCSADEFGFAHCLWTETLFETQQTIIQYSRFDGDTWSPPNDIYLSDVAITNISPFVDQHGTLHIAWAVGLSGPAYYTYAPAQDAIAVQRWASPLVIDIGVRRLDLRIDANDAMHLLYSDQMEEPGMYYMRSLDHGSSWSAPLWLDPDIRTGHIPDRFSFELDETGGMHALWSYGAIDQSARPDWIRYAHSLDGGDTWSTPFTIDQHSEEGEHNLNTAGPVMAVSGRTVHVIWAAGPLPYRYYRSSSDAGQSWSSPRRLFGELHGQAGDGFAVDGAGRLHYFAQIRYPVGVYHSYWSGVLWSPPALIYRIADPNTGEVSGDRIHAHGLDAVVRSGNQLVLTLADGPADPNRRLFVMHRMLDDIPAREPMATPPPVPVDVSVTTPDISPTQSVATPTATVAFFDASQQTSGSIPAPNDSLRFALIPTILLIGGAIVIRLLLSTLKSYVS